MVAMLLVIHRMNYIFIKRQHNLCEHFLLLNYQSQLSAHILDIPLHNQVIDIFPNRVLKFLIDQELLGPLKMDQSLQKGLIAVIGCAGVFFLIHFIAAE